MEDYSAANCQKAFMELREQTQKKLKKLSMEEREEAGIDIISDLLLSASKNDPVAQDYLAYIFKKGFQPIVPENHEKFMQWQILAAANGNQYSIDKLSLFLNFAFKEILAVDDIGYIVKRNNLTSSNFEYVIGRLMCEAIADEMRLEAKQLIKEPLEHKEFDARTMRNFDRARDFVVGKILKFLRN